MDNKFFKRSIRNDLSEVKLLIDSIKSSNQLKNEALLNEIDSYIEVIKVKLSMLE